MSEFKYKHKSTGEVVDGVSELMFEDGPYADVKFILGEMKFADEENSDGSIDMSFNYDITNGKEVDDGFKTTLGELITYILVQQIEKGEVVYKGGTGESAFV